MYHYNYVTESMSSNFTALSIGNINGCVAKPCSSLMVQLYVDALPLSKLVTQTLNIAKTSILMESAKYGIFPYPVT